MFTEFYCMFAFILARKIICFISQYIFPVPSLHCKLLTSIVFALNFPEFFTHSFHFPSYRQNSFLLSFLPSSPLNKTEEKILGEGSGSCLCKGLTSTRMLL
jgi:hypothetical protein